LCSDISLGYSAISSQSKRGVLCAGARDRGLTLRGRSVRYVRLSGCRIRCQLVAIVGYGIGGFDDK
jgi:hypothetical protein